jgi:hypothetical protein
MILTLVFNSSKAAESAFIKDFDEGSEGGVKLDYKKARIEIDISNSNGETIIDLPDAVMSIII